MHYGKSADQIAQPVEVESTEALPRLVQGARTVLRQLPQRTGSFEVPAAWRLVRGVAPHALDRFSQGPPWMNSGQLSAAKPANAALHSQEAATLEPARQAALLGQSLTALRQWTSGALPLAKAHSVFQHNLERALAIDDTGAEVNYIRALNSWYFFWNWDAAAAQFEQALTVNPSFVEACRDAAVFHALAGDFRKALDEARRAVATDPFSPAAQVTLGTVHRIARRYDQALLACRRTLDLDPRHHTAWELPESIHHNLGLRDEEVECFQRQLQIQGTSPTLISDMLATYQRQGYGA